MSTARQLLDATGDILAPIILHRLPLHERVKLRSATHLLVDHIIAVGEAQPKESDK